MREVFLRSYRWVLTAPNVVLGKELLCLTEDTVDLGTADWADALGHATT